MRCWPSWAGRCCAMRLSRTARRWGPASRMGSLCLLCYLLCGCAFLCFLLHALLASISISMRIPLLQVFVRLVLVSAPELHFLAGGASWRFEGLSFIIGGTEDTSHGLANDILR